MLVTPTDIDYLTLSLNAGETLTLIGAPTTSDLQLTMTFLDPSDNVVATGSAPGQGSNAVIETAPITTTGTYTIEISDLNGNIGLYSVQAYLNALVKQGTSNDTIATATDISGSSYQLGIGGADRLGVVGSLPNYISTGDVFVSSRYYDYYYPGGPADAIVRVNEAGSVVQVIPVPQDQLYSLSGVELDPVNNMLYAAVTTSFNTNSVSGELLEFNPSTGQEVATITLPDDNVENYYYYPYGFSIASDGSFWIPQPNSGNIIHLDASYNEIGTYATSGLMPESASIGTDGNVYFSATIRQCLPTQSHPPAPVNLFATRRHPSGTLTALRPQVPASGPLITMTAVFSLDYSGNLQTVKCSYGTIRSRLIRMATSGMPTTSYYDMIKYDRIRQ